MQEGRNTCYSHRHTEQGTNKTLNKKKTSTQPSIYVARSPPLPNQRERKKDQNSPILNPAERTLPGTECKNLTPSPSNRNGLKHTPTRHRPRNAVQKPGRAGGRKQKYSQQLSTELKYRHQNTGMHDVTSGTEAHAVR